jgi:hypothetical protein
MNSEALKKFRQAAYKLLVKAKDATFELMDAIMTMRNFALSSRVCIKPIIYPLMVECLDVAHELATVVS